MPVLTQADEQLCNEFTAFATTDAALGVDLSHFATDLTNTSGQLSGSSDDRWSAEEFTLTLEIYLEGDVGAELSLFRHVPATPGDDEAQIRRQGDDLSIFWTTDGSGGFGSVQQITLPDWSGSDGVWRFVWSVWPNPDPGADPDAAVVHHLVVVGPSGGVRMARFHTFARPSGSASVFVGNATDDLRVAVFDHAALPAGYALARIDGLGSAPSSETLQHVESPALLEETDTGASGALYGPQSMMAARHHTTALQRTFSPLVNERFNRATPITATVDDDVARYRHAAPGWASGSENHYMFLGWYRRRKVPRLANFLYCRVHVRSVVSSGAAVPVAIRVWSFRGERPIQSQRFHVETVITRDDTGNVGSWVEFDLLRISFDDDGFTKLCISVAIDPAAASSNDANATVYINAWSVSPRATEASQGVAPYGE